MNGRWANYFPVSARLRFGFSHDGSQPQGRYNAPNEILSDYPANFTTLEKNGTANC